MAGKLNREEGLKSGLLRFGTCSWKYDSWRGLVYPAGKKINYLREYARKYNSVEVDQWFWSLFGTDNVALPSPATVREYADAVPEDFVFTVKVPNSITLTHFYKKSKGDPLVANPHFLSVELFQQFLELLEPLQSRLGPLMFQFEYLNKQKMSGLEEFLDRSAAFLKQLPDGFDYAFEIRNPNYLKPAYFESLSQQRLTHVFLAGYYMPPVTELYSRFGNLLSGQVIIRLHGPDRADIEERSGGIWNRVLDDREKDLSEVSRMILDLLRRDIKVYVNVNNHYEGSAPLTIKRLQKLLAESV